MQLEIKEVTIGKTGTNKKGVKWTQYFILFADGQKVSTFDHKIATMAGKTIEAELIQDGQFTNLGKWELVDITQTSPEVPQQATGKIEPHTTTIAPQEKGMWWKEAGECLRAGLIDKDDNGAGTYLWKAYIKQMLIAIDVPIAPKPATSAKVKAPAKVTEEEPPIEDERPF